MSNFNAKSAFITGGTKGLGLAVAKLFAQNAVEDLFLGYRSDEEGAQQAQAELKSMGCRCELLQADLSEPGAMDKVFSQIAEKTDRLDAYIHNAAATAFKPLKDIQAHHIAKTFNISITSFVEGVQKASALMPEGGYIVAVSGMDTYRVVPNHGLLAAAKAGLEQLTMYWAHELASQNIQVNAVNPGFLETDSTKKYLGPMFQKVSDFYSQSVPLKRSGKLEEVAQVIKFLCSSEASWVVGQTFRVDGGFDHALDI